MLKIDEKYFEDILYKNLQTEEGTQKLNNRGLFLSYEQHFLLYRQLNLRDYGIPDIVKVSFLRNRIQIHVIELKVTEFDLSQLLQLGRYVAGIHSIISSNVTLQNRTIDIKAVLIVSDFNGHKDYSWIGSLLDSNVSVYSTNYELEGMHFKKQLPGNWIITDSKTDLKGFIDISEFKKAFKESYTYFINNPPIDLPF